MLTWEPTDPRTMVEGHLQQYWLDKFRVDGGDELLYKDLNLNKYSIVVDAGAHQGEFTNEIFKRYCSNILLLEPDILNRTLTPPNCKLYTAALTGNHTGVQTFIKHPNSSLSGFFTPETKDTEDIIVDTISVPELFKVIHRYFDTGIINLLKLNVEGAEYDILLNLLDGPLHKSVDSILVQFHYISNSSQKDREVILDLLQDRGFKTKFSYPFVWEYYSK